MTSQDLNILSRGDLQHPGKWWHREGDLVVCDLCPRECKLHEGDRGFCFVRQNVDDQMVLTTYGKSTGFCIDPIEKKPLNHFYPGTSVLSFGTAGCNLGCKFCQNWDISKSREVERLSSQATPDAIARAALSLDCRSVAFTYNDPIIWAEYAIDTAMACREVGVKSVAVTAGYITEQARGEFYRAMDAANVDLKAFTEDFYYKLTLSHLDPVLDTIKWLKAETDVWFEITNLIIPDANDSPDELKRLSEWVLNAVGDEVPVHFSAFHPDYRMMDRPRTPQSTLNLARDIARSVGIKHVYTGNVNDVERQSTYCHGCGGLVIERNQYALGMYHLDADGCCLSCGCMIAGHFENAPGNWGRKRQRVDMRAYADESDRVAAGSNVTDGRVFGNPTATRNDTGQQSSQQEVPRMSVSFDELTDQQASNVLDAAAEFLIAAVENRAATSDLAEMAVSPVHGTFVSIKRAGQLRSCCGTIGNPRPLAESLQMSAKRTATDDPRFPPVSSSELVHLEMEVWLLGACETVTEVGTDRVSAVEVGKHGLVISQGKNRGLLLPGVPVEQGWNAEQFLGRTCVKAGLPPTAWQDSDTLLQRFPGAVFSRKLLESPGSSKPAGIFAPREFAQYAQHARQTIETMVAGGVPMYYVAGVPDKNVLGVGVVLERTTNPDKPDDHLVVSKLHWKKTQPMQATLHSICQNVAGLIAKQQMKKSEVQISMFVADDAAMHGYAASADLAGFDPKRRGLLVVQGHRMAMVFDSELEPTAILAQAIEKAQVREPQQATVFSVQVQTNKDRLTVMSAPRASVDTRTRPPAVAGRFYPGNPTEIATQLDEMLGDEVAKRAYPAAMVPHAGWRFSGRLACDVLKRIQLPKTVIVIGPKHTRDGLEWAVAPHKSWTLPGGELAADVELAQKLAGAIPHLALDAAAHRTEHAIEVELPIIQRLAPETKVVGIAVSGGSVERCDDFAAGLADVIREMEEPPLLLVSSDMNHFANDAETRRLDELALAKIDALDADGLLSTCLTNQISMCGVLPAVIVMKTLQRLNRLNRAERVGYATSSEVSGDVDRVVGYAGVLFE